MAAFRCSIWSRTSTCQAPASRAGRALCPFDTVAITRPPRWVESRVSIRPTPLPAEWTRTTASFGTGTATYDRYCAVIACITPPPVAAKRKRQTRRWGQTAADVGVHEVDASRLHLDDDLVGFRCRNRSLFDAQHLGGALF